MEPTLPHITSLVAANRSILPENQKVLIGQALESWRKNRGSVSEVKIDDDWSLRMVVRNFDYNDRSWITPFLTPVEKDEYSGQWVEKHAKEVKRNIKPDHLAEVVAEATDSNFCVKDVEIIDVDPFDLGGFDQVKRIIYDSRYEKPEEVSLVFPAAYFNKRQP